MASTIINGRDLIAFFEPQTGGLDTLPAAWPTGGSVKAVRMNQVQLNPDSPTGEPPKWKTGSRTELGDLPKQIGFSVSMEHYPYGVGAALTERDWELLYASGGWKVLTGPAATTITTGATTTNLPIASVSGLSQFMPVIVESNGQLEIRLITTVNGSDVDIYPPLPAAPANGAAVTFGRTLQLDDDWDVETSSIAAWFFNGSKMLHRVTGLIQEQSGWGGSADAEVVCTHSGKAYRIERIFATTLGADIADAVVTSMTVNEANCVPDDINTARTVYYQIDDEIVGVTASNGTGTLTITRGAFSTTAASHSTGAQVNLYVPTPSYSGINPTGVNSGGFGVWQSTTPIADFCVSGFNADIAYGVSTAGCFGASYAVGQAASSAPTEVGMQANAWARLESSLVIANYGDSRTPLALQATIGETLGRIMAAMTPQLYPHNPPLDVGAEIVTLDLTGRGVGDESLGSTNPPGAETSIFFLLG